MVYFNWCCTSILNPAKINIAVIGDCNVDNIRNYIAFNFLRDGKIPNIYVGDPGNYLIELLNEEGDLYRFKPDICLVLISGKDWEFKYLNGSLNPMDIFSELKLGIQKLSHFSNCEVLINEVVMEQYQAQLIISRNNRDAFKLKVRKFNDDILNYSMSSKFLRVLSTIEVERNSNNLISDVNRFYAKRLFSDSFLNNIVLETLKIKRSEWGLAKKCIVLDLDNTLWGGILGEVGWDHIDLGDDFPGNDFKLFQRYLLNLKKQGVLLAIASKNDLRTVKEVFERNSNMILTMQDFVSIKVNWNPKDKNVHDIAMGLNIDESSLLFIDDSSFERHIVFENTSAYVLRGDGSPMSNITELSKDGWFNVNTLTREDEMRTEQYLTNKVRNKYKEKSDYRSYLNALQLKVRLVHDDMTNVDRLAELNFRTNQFNMTTRRFPLEKMKDLILDRNFLVISIAVSDRFGDYGICGLIVLKIADKKAKIINMILSCRVFERGIEEFSLKMVLGDLFSNGILSIKADYIQTKKNRRFKYFYKNMGFAITNENEHEINYELNHLNVENSKIKSTWIELEKNDGKNSGKNY